MITQSTVVWTTSVQRKRVGLHRNHQTKRTDLFFLFVLLTLSFLLFPPVVLLPLSFIHSVGLAVIGGDDAFLYC